MNIDFIINKMKDNMEDIALVTDGKEYKYSYLIAQYEKSKKILDKNNIISNKIVALKGEFTPDNIGMMLAIIERNCIYVPIANSIKNLEKYLEIAEVQFFIEEKSIKEINTDEPKHEILRKLLKESNPGLILFSSGTTGDPKAAVHNLIPLLEKYKTPGKKLSSIAFLLFDHIGGFNTVMYNISNGGLLATLKNRSPEEVANLIEKYRIEVLPTSPSFINMILFSKIYEKYDFSSLKIISYGTEPMPESTLKAFHELYPRIVLKQTYGLSEVGIMRTKSEASDSLWLKVGGDDEHQIKIVDGILYIKSKMSMLGYLNAASPFDSEGWLNTRDKVEQKGEYIKILGRESELINIGGEKVYPAEVESVLLEIEGVKDAIVLKEANPILGNIITCKVSVDENENQKELKKRIQKYCSEKLEKFKRPVKIEFQIETFNTERFKRKR
ncbi:MAG: ANL family adenylate-forming protein [Cetobacterium sp.]